jgi:hypothetical protein
MGYFLFECGLEDGADSFKVSFQVLKVVHSSLDLMTATQGLQFFATGRDGQGAQRSAAGFKAVRHSVECRRIVRFDCVA